jgi:transcriptional regulator CtsR
VRPSCTNLKKIYNKIKVKESQSQLIKEGAMRNISDLIEQYIKQILINSSVGFVEIQRSHLADVFKCVPSQINYVIDTRFTKEKGYLVESKRGGGGFIRIHKISPESNDELYREIINMIGDHISQASAEDIIERLYEENLLTSRERLMVRSLISRKVLNFNIPVRDQLRARMMKSILATLFLIEEGEKE